MSTILIPNLVFDGADPCPLGALSKVYSGNDQTDNRIRHSRHFVLRVMTIDS